MGFYVVRGVFHGDAAACGFQHGNIVISVTGGVGVGNGNSQIVAQIEQGASLAGAFLEELQITAAGIDGLNFIFSPVFNISAEGLQFVKVM